MRARSRAFLPSRLLWLGAAALAVLGMVAGEGCSARIGGGGLTTDGGGPGPVVPLVYAPAHARRLSVTEVKNSLRDLFGLDLATFPDTFPADATQYGFDNDFESLSANPNFASALQGAAEWAGAAAVAKLPSLLPCDATAKGEMACVQQFIDTYGPRIYRRPLTADERGRLVQVFTTTRGAEDYRTSLATVIEAALQSPAFLFRTELGANPSAATRLTGDEVASALSYFLWQTTPDDALLGAAKDGGLETREAVAAQVQRMVQDPRAAVAARTMFIQWLGMGQTLAMTKTDPAFDAGVAASMLAEMSTFLDRTVWAGPHGYTDLFTSPSTFVDGNLAMLYGVAPPSGSGLQPISLDPALHAGILTMPGLIATHTPGFQRSPIQLGHFVRSTLLCQPLPAPPPGIPPPPADPNLDVHARFLQHDRDPSCQGCHSRMDPIGFGWSRYDVLGRLVPVDHGVTEDGQGALTATDVDGPFQGPVDLAARLRRSAEVQACFAKTVAQWALGRAASDGGAHGADGDLLQRELQSGFTEGDLKALFATVATSNTFLVRDATAEPAGATP